MTELLLTIDVDWAPDFVIDAAASELAAAGVRATWFITHRGPAIERLEARPDLFELGVHPNFMPGSSHGNSVRDVLAACMSLAPQAISMRTHGLVQSTQIFMDVLASTPVRADVSIFMPDAADLRPFVYRFGDRELRRVAYCWEDDYEMQQPRPDWTLHRLLAQPGLRIVDFHPIHVYLNSSRFDEYEALKRTTSRLTDATPAQVDAHVRGGSGTGTLFRDVVAHLAVTGGSRTVAQVLGLAPAPAAVAR